MIKREDMLELTRRMTPSRSSMTRIAGCYMDRDGDMDGSFNTNFLNLSLSEKEKNLVIAKTIPFASTNEEIKEFRIKEEKKGADSMWRLLMGIRECGLKNDALLYNFYELIAEKYHPGREYAIFVFHDRYDVPVKAEDKERLGESEEVYEYLICAICPLVEEYEPGMPEYGFLFPSFSDRSMDLEHVAVFGTGEKYSVEEMAKNIFG